MSQSWLPIANDSHFSLANIPFGIISTTDNPKPRPAIAIGSNALDLGLFVNENGFISSGVPGKDLYVFYEPNLNAFAALGRSKHRAIREYLQEILSKNTKYGDRLKDNKEVQGRVLVPLEHVRMHLPMAIGDYTDFYAGKNHAYNVGVLFRGPSNALQPNYMHLPVGYHGRASSVVVSGTPITRPNGQILENPTGEPKTPVFSPCRRLDMELELGAFLCKPNKMGEPVPIAEAAGNVFGYVLLNDWSARDIQAWEYVPLGPFNAKNFGTSISAWVVLADALEPFLTEGIKNDVQLLPYLQEAKKKNMYDIHLEVQLTSKYPPYHTAILH